MNIPKKKYNSLIAHIALIVAVLIISVIPGIGSASALAFQAYDQASKVVSLHAIPFFWNDVADIQLIDNTYQCTDCSATIKVSPNENGNVADFEWNFYQITDGEKIKINDFNTPTLNSISLSIKQGEGDSWEPLSNQEFKKGEEFYLRLDGKKDADTTIDWVPTMFTATLNVWALWGTFNNYLITENLTLSPYGALCHAYVMINYTKPLTANASGTRWQVSEGGNTIK